MLKPLLEESTYCIVLTGAGMSTESGIPDFRSSLRGIWKDKNPMALASVQALENNREAFFEFYRSRLEGLKPCEPHRGHYVLAELEKKRKLKAVITQNVDGLHRKAGSENVIELHGNIRCLSCMLCKEKYDDSVYLMNAPYCKCGGFIRPDVVLFGEALPEEAVDKAYDEIEKADLLIVLGSSLSVYPANQLPLHAKERGAKLVVVNFEPTELDLHADLLIQEKMIGELLSEWSTPMDLNS
ncbi:MULTISPECIES: NAD-dependent protein deacylase [unclassified Paenibacillus]|uniref:NAD-dependent protein deacylase n=1 Tax=unclassified Paenibacillus TaxID=185978 RepID=UPI001AE43BF2|nr:MULTISPECIES: NAD-dependent protein deacylase [unclassified Paenibacillus]MBP1154004.1 NAD-dependent deacetylase [Paenibacillus sp. PvP091]MBP1170611.1 NAD-dependent deacetylase [Paenibacillus sp. PvR098]MBP2441639.1 NAD-dependent deacetylase [Paenibacillus sp. PvP052]